MAGGLTVAGRFTEIAARRSDATAVMRADGTETSTFTELAERIRRQATWFSAHGVRPGDRVAIVQGNSVDHLVGWFATLHLGAIVVDVSFLLGAGELERILRDATPTILVTDRSGHVTDAAHAAGIPVLAATDPVVEESGAPVARQLDSPAVIAYTSGTTGLPKGVVHTHGSIIRQIELLHDVCGYDETWLVYVAIPLFALHGFLPQVAAPLLAGGTVLLDDKFDAGRLAEVSRRHPVSYTTLSSPMVPRLLALGPDDRPDFSHAHLLSCGGSPLHPEVRQAFERAFSVPLTQGYACTEVLGAFVMDIGGVAPPGAAGRVYPSSRPDGGAVVRIVDDDHRPLANGERGEIMFHRDVALAGYWNSPHLTEEAFVDHDWYATGDVGSLDEAGFLSILDRKKDMIIRGGFNIYSAEIERALTEHPAVAEAAVIGRPDATLGEVPVAYVVLGEKVAVDDLRAHVLDQLGVLKVPALIEVVAADQLPRNALGKVLKAELRARWS